MNKEQESVDVMTEELIEEEKSLLQIVAEFLFLILLKLQSIKG